MDFLVVMLVTVALVGTVIAVSFALYRRTLERQNVAWAAAADRLGVVTRPASLTKRHEMSGRIEEFGLRVSQIRSDDQTMTRFRLDFHGTGIPYRLRSESGWTRMIRLIGVADVAVGDAVFDEAVRVKSDDPDRLRDFLHAGRRAVASAFLGSQPSAEIRDGEVRVTEGGTPSDASEIVDRVRAMLAVARVFDDPSLVPEPAPIRSADEESAFDPGEPEPQDVAFALELEAASGPPPSPPERRAEPVDPVSLVADVLDGDMGVMQALEVFEERYVGRPMRVTGEVLRTERAGATGRPGKIIVRLARVRSGSYTERDVEAHIAVGDAELPERGQEFEVDGMLERIDPIMRRAYVTADAP